MTLSLAPKLCPGACSDPGKARMRQEGMGSWWSMWELSHCGGLWPPISWEISWVRTSPPEAIQLLSRTAFHDILYKQSSGLSLFRWNFQLSWEKLVFICFRRGPIETLGVFPSWNTWRKTSGFDPKKALSKKYVKQTWQWIINIPKIPSMWGKNKTGKEDVFSTVK